VGTVFKIVFASHSITGTTFQVIVEMAPPGGTFSIFARARTGTFVTFDSSGQPTGDYEFRVTLKDTGAGNKSGRSPAVFVTVTE
jgi:hypothetical protein